MYKSMSAHLATSGALPDIQNKNSLALQRRRETKTF